jgi:hypothetical protein
MTHVQIEAGTLLASVDERTISGLLLPYGEVGNTNLGRFTVAASTVAIPADVSVVSLNTDHSRESPVGRASSITETPEGLMASFTVAKTPEGDAALIDPKRRKLSVEVSDIVLRAGALVSGRLFGSALVEKGAWPSATLLAADVGTPPETPPAGAPSPAEGPKTTIAKSSETFTDEDGLERIRETTITTVVDGDTTTITTTEIITDPTPDTAGDQTVTLPNTLTASKTSTGPAPLSKTQVFATLHAIHQGTADAAQISLLEANSGPASRNLFAALADVKFDGTGGLNPVMTQPQWIGELWDGVAYEQQVAPLFGHGDLTSKTINGFRWTTKPTGGTWTGNKTAIPSGTVTAVPYTTTAQNFAGGHDIAREHRDFNTPGFFESYYAAMAESYAQWVDETVVLADILAAATTSMADDPAGLSIGAGLSAIIDGASEVITAKALPSFALVAPALWKQIMKTPSQNTLGYLSAALGLKDGQLAQFTIRPSSLIAAGSVLVGAREAATVYELPGTPIRVEAPDMVKGGLDTGVFGYAGTVVHKATALQLMTAYSGV